MKNKKQIKNSKLIKLSELSLAGATLASLNLNVNTQKSVKAANSVNKENTQGIRGLNSNALTRMMNENSSTPVQNGVDKATNTVNQLNASNSADSNPTVTANADNGGFDSSWGKLDVKDWKGHVDGDYYVLDKYTGDLNNIIVPNAADFKKAGIDIQGKQVGINADTTHSWFETGDPKSIAFSKTDGNKIKAIGTDWTAAFTGNESRKGGYEGKSHDLNKFDGNSLDTSNVTDMSYMFCYNKLKNLSGLQNWKVDNVTNMSSMFSSNQINDLSSLKDWNVSNVTNMNSIFESNQIENLMPLRMWNVSNVTDMGAMFSSNQINDLSPLKDWSVSNVTNMNSIFSCNQITDLMPLKNWDVSHVTNMGFMFGDNGSHNQISDLTPIANWNVSNVTNMSFMFSNTKIEDLTPLKDWDTSKVTDMSAMFVNDPIKNLNGLTNWNTNKVTNMRSMFCRNNISDLTPLTNWKTSKVVDMDDMFENNKISNLVPLKNWNVSNVTDMNEMFWKNQIEDLTPLTNWKVDNVTNMESMFKDNQIEDLTPLTNWKVDNVTNMGGMFQSNDISDLTSISNWNVSNVTDMDNMFDYNPVKNADFSKWNFSKILKKNQYNSSGLYRFISSNTRHAIINLGDNNSLPNWFMQVKVNNNNNYNDNYNLFTDNRGGNIILTSNSKLLANPNNNFNHVVFDINGTKQKIATPVFIDSTPDKILQMSKQLQQQVINIFKSNHVKLNYKYINPIQASYINFKDYAYNPQTGKWDNIYQDSQSPYDPSDPVDVLNAIIPVTPRKTIKFQFKDSTSNKLLDSDTQTLTEPDADVAIDYSSINSAITKLQQSGYDVSNITSHEPNTIAKDWNDTISTPSNPSASDPYTVSTDSSTNTTTITYNIFHLKAKVTHDAPKSTSDTIPNTTQHYPKGVDKDDLNKTLTRTITFKDENGKNIKDPVTQTVHMYRDATIDAITGAVTYTDWTTDESFDSVDVPKVKGYTPDKSAIAKVDAPKDGQNYNTSVVYNRNNENVSITYIDDTTGKVIASDQSDSKYGDTVKFDSDPTAFIQQLKDKGYELVSNDYKDSSIVSDDPTENKFTVHVKERMIQVTHDAPKTTSDTIEGTTQKYPDGVTQDDLNKTITQKVEFKDENGRELASAQEQTVHATRDATVNAVTGKVTYTDWTTDGSFKDVTAPDVKGYTPDESQITGTDKPTVGTDYNKTVTYTRDTKNVSIKYVDDTTGTVLKTDTAKIKYNDPVKFNTAPSDYIDQLKKQGYDIVSNNLKEGTTVSADDDTNTFTVHVKQRSIKVTHNAPKSTSDTIEGTTKNYPTGVSQEDLNKTLTRTIVFKDENGKSVDKSVTQTVHATRDATVNAVTGKVTYTDWTVDGSFDTVPVPKKDGYTADKTTIDKVDSPKVGQDYNTSVIYTHNTEDSSITYVDDTTGKVLKTDTSTPKYGDVIKFETTPSDYIEQLKAKGYEIVSNDYNDDATASTNPDKNKFTVHVKQRNVKVTYDAPKTTDDTISGTTQKYPKGVTKDDLNKSITRTIVLKDTDGKVLHDPIIQTVKMHRNATVNAVTGDVQYTPWTAESNFDSVDVPKKDGYTPDKTTIDKVELPKDGQNYNTSVIYTRNTEDSSITYVDDTTGEVLKTDKATPKYGDKFNFETNPSDYIDQLKSKGYEVVSNDFSSDATASTDPAQNKFTVHVKQRTVQVTHNAPKSTSDTVNGTTQKYPDGVNKDDLNKTITRTITLKSPDGKDIHEPITQTVHVHRDVTVNVVTGKVTYTSWTAEGSFDAVQIPTVKGYTPDKTIVNKVDAPQPDQKYDTSVTYIRNDETASIKYIDDTTGKTLKTDTAKLKFGDPIKFETAPSEYIKQLESQGYKMVSNNFKSDATASTEPDENQFEVHVKQGTVQVNHTAPKSTEDTVDQTNVHYPKGVAKDDLNRTITRTVVLKDENGKNLHDPIVQTVHAHRDATVNIVTGDVQYTPWTTDDNFESIQVPEVKGYTADKTEIPAVSKPDVNKGYNVSVIYTRNNEDVSITYVDDTTGKIVKTDSIEPKFGDTIKFNNNPADYIKQLESQGYVVVSNNFKDGSTVSTEPDENKFVVHLKENSTQVRYDAPKSTEDTINGTSKKYPKGVNKTDLNQQITRTVVLKDENGKILKNPITQTVTVHRDAVVNNVTGAITYTDWTNNGTFDSIDVPQIDGYTADKVKIKNVDDPQVGQDYNTAVVYTRNDEDATITYVDDTTGSVLKTDTAKPKFSDEIKFDVTPADYIKQLEAKGYEVVSNNYQDGATAKSDSNKNKFTVHVKHRLINVERSKDVHEHISYNVTDSNGKTTNEDSQRNPTLHFTQSGVKDEVTGKTDWNGKLNSQTFSSVNTVKRPGYVADITTIPSKTVTITNGDWNKNHDIDTTVNYKPEVEHVKLVVKDEQGNVVKAIEKSGKFGENYDFSNIKAPEINGYTFVKMSDNAKGKFGVENKDIVLTYKKNDSKSDVPVTPDKPEQPTKPNKPSSPSKFDTSNTHESKGNKGNVSNNTNRTNNNENHENNISNTNVNRGKQNTTNISSNTNSNVSSNNTNNSSNSNSNAITDVFKQNIAKQQDDTLPEMAESTKDQALIGLSAVSLVGLIGVAGVQLKKHKN